MDAEITQLLQRHRSTLLAMGYDPREIHAALRAVAAQGLDAEADAERWLGDCLRWLSGMDHLWMKPFHLSRKIMSAFLFLLVAVVLRHFIKQVLNLMFYWLLREQSHLRIF